MLKQVRSMHRDHAEGDVYYRFESELIDGNAFADGMIVGFR